MRFHVSLNIGFSLLSLVANGTTPESVSRFIHILDHGLCNLFLQSWKENTSQEFISKLISMLKHSEEVLLVRLFVVCFDMAS